MKVLHLIDSGGLYGAERMLLALVKEQLAQGLDPMILSAGEPRIVEKKLEAEARRLGLPITPWRMKPGLNIPESWKILKWARSKGFEIMHSHGFKFNILLGSYHLAIRQIPMVATLHGYVHARRFSKMWLYELLDRFAISMLQGVVLVGESMKKELPDTLCQSKKLRVIRNGMDVSGIIERSEQAIDPDIDEFLTRHSPIIIGVGRLSQEKGFHRLLEAFQMVSDQYESSGLIIVGEGKQKANLEQRSEELGIARRVLMPGYCNNVPGLQRRSDLLVMPSLTEGLPITLLEAMAVGTSVLVSPVGEMPAVLGDGKGGNILARDVDDRQLASSICEALDDPDREEKTAWAAKMVSEQYSVRAMENSYRSLYQSTLGEKV